MTDLVIRELQDLDVPAAARLLSQAFTRSSADNRANLYKELRKSDMHVVVGAFKEDQLVGVAKSLFQRVLDNGECEICLYGVTADPAMRGQGVGKSMLAVLEEHSASKWLGHNNEGYFMLVDGSKKTCPQSSFYEDQGYAARTALATNEGDPVLYKPAPSLKAPKF